MGGRRVPGPICEVRDWFADGDDKVIRHQTCGFVDSPRELTVAPPAESFNRLRIGVTRGVITQPRALATFAWPYGQATAALEQTIRLSGHDILVTRPGEALPAGQYLPTVEQVEVAFRAIPSRQRQRTATVKLCPWPSLASRPGHVVAGESGADDIVLFPLSRSPPQVKVDTIVMHEPATTCKPACGDPQRTSAHGPT